MPIDPLDRRKQGDTSAAEPLERRRVADAARVLIAAREARVPSDSSRWARTKRQFDRLDIAPHSSATIRLVDSNRRVPQLEPPV